MATALSTLVFLAAVFVSIALQQRADKSRTWFTFPRLLINYLLPFGIALCLINVGWRAALVTLALWILALAFTPLYVTHIEGPAERAATVRAAKAGEHPVLYLYSFAAQAALSPVENLLHTVSSSYEPGDDMYFRFSPLALGDENRAGFPKLSTPGPAWWGEFVELAEASAAIFLLPAMAHADPQAGIMLELEYVLVRHPEKTIVVVPDAESWQRLAGGDGEAVDPQTRWNRLRDVFARLPRSVRAPEYRSAGLVFHLADTATANPVYKSYDLSPAGVLHALSTVTKTERDRSKQARKEFEAEFKQLNGMSIDEYYRTPGKKHPPFWPV